MALILGVPTLNRYDLLSELVASVELGSLQPDWYVLIDNGGQMHDKLHKRELSLPIWTKPVMIHRPEKNLGCSGSWNMILRKAHGDESVGPHTVVITGDDIVFGERTLELMVEKAKESSRLFICANGASAWSLFLQKPELVQKIGWYDEKFWPAYYEDNDYHRRMLLAGEDYDGIAPEGAVTHKTSSTIEAMSKEDRTAFDVEFNKNQRYYGIKWGGPPGYEKFTAPAPNSESER